MNPRAREIHRDALIVDGLVFMGDGSTETLDAGNIAAANMTVCHFEADFEQSGNAPTARMTPKRSPGIIGEFVRAFGNDIRARHLEDCATRAELVGSSSALLDRGWGETELRGFLGANLLRALDLARAP